MLSLSTIVICLNFASFVSAKNDAKISLKIRDEHHSNLYKHLKKSGNAEHQMILSSNGHEFLENFEKTIFYGELSIGTPWKNFTAVIDTTQPDMLVPSVSCGYSCGSRERYDSSKSSSYIRKGQSYNAEYRGKDITGFQSMDSIYFAEFDVDFQGFVEVTKVSDASIDSTIDIDVIMGFGYKENSVNGVPNPYERIQEDFALTNDEFAIYYSNNTNELGQLTIGYLNSSDYGYSSIVYHDLVANTFWVLKMEGFSVGGLTVDASIGSQVQIDTASAFITGPKEEVALIAEELGAWEIEGMPGFYTVGCDFTLPSFNPVIAGYKYYIKSGDYLYRIEDSTTCLLGIVGRDLKSPIDDMLMWSFGDTFLKGHYSVFNSYYGRIGFASL